MTGTQNNPTCMPGYARQITEEEQLRASGMQAQQTAQFFGLASLDSPLSMQDHQKSEDQ